MKKVLVLLVVGLLAGVSVVAVGTAGAKRGHPKAHALAKARGAVHGIVQAVGSDSVTLKRKKHAAVVVEVNGDTKIRVGHRAGTLADIQVGYRAIAKLSKGGGPAKWLRAKKPHAKRNAVTGKISAVGSDSLTLTKKKDGSSVTFSVTSDTKIRLNGKPATLGDLAPGFRAVVKLASDGSAAAIRAVDPATRPVALVGKVTAVGSDSLEVTLRNGASATVAVTSATKIRVGGQAASLSDIQVGYRAVVLRAGHSGAALLIVARAPKH